MRSIAKFEAYKILNRTIYNKIGNVFHQLKAECSSQLIAKLQ